MAKNLPAIQETWVRSLGGKDPLEKGNSYPLQYSGLENSTVCIVHGVTKSRTQLSGFHFLFFKKKTRPLIPVPMLFFLKVIFEINMGTSPTQELDFEEEISPVPHTKSHILLTG